VAIAGPGSPDPLATFCKNPGSLDMPVIPAEALSKTKAVRIVFKTKWHSKSTFSLSWTELHPYGMASARTTLT
jgi:hypothetical protein